MFRITRNLLYCTAIFVVTDTTAVRLTFIEALGAGGVNANIFDCAWQPARNNVAARIPTDDNVFILFTNVMISP